MSRSGWVPDGAEYFTICAKLGGSGLSIVFFGPIDQMPIDTYPIGELPGMLARNDVLQQIRDSEAKRPSRLKQPRYTAATGEDWIDECERTLTWPEFVGAMKFTIGKYLRRLGKKDDEVQELEKVADYAERLLQAAKRRIDTHV